MDKNTCNHKYVLLETSKFTKYGDYNTQFVRIDRFFCEKCLDEQEKRRSEYSRETPEWYKNEVK